MELYAELSIWRGARHLGIGRNTLIRWLDKHSIKRHGKVVFTGKGEKRPQLWKEHTYTCRRTGYVMHKNPGARRHAFQHREVMERQLGRPLAKNERVHHINNKSNDNRVENLYLYENQTEHKLAERELFYIAFELYEKGVIGFKDGKYYIK